MKTQAARMDRSTRLPRFSKWMSPLLVALIFIFVTTLVFTTLKSHDKSPTGTGNPIKEMADSAPEETINTQECETGDTITREGVKLEGAAVVGTPLRPQTTKSHEGIAKPDDLEAKERALQLINHINFTIYKIIECNDSMVLEEEYKALNPSSLRLDSIDDQQTIETIKQLLEFLVDMRIDSKEREFLEQAREDSMADLLQGCLPDPTSCISVNPWATAAKIAGAAFNSVNAYNKGKKKIEKQFQKASWELEKSKMRSLNKLNQSLLQNHWELVKLYKIDDLERVTEDDIKELMNRLKDRDLNRKYMYLCEHMKKFAKFPLYWYYRSQAAHECKDWLGAIQAVHEYEKIHLQILRKDRIYALIEMIKLNSMVEGKLNNDNISLALDVGEIKRSLDVIDENLTYDDWNMLYLSACLRYSVCHDHDKARKKMKNLVDHLAYKSENRFVEWKGLNSDRKNINKRVGELKARIDRLEKEQKEKRDNNEELVASKLSELNDLRQEYDDKKMLPLTIDSRPNVNALYACRTALMKMEADNLPKDKVTEIAKTIIQSETTAAHEKLFLYGLVRTQDIENKMKEEFKNVTLSFKTVPTVEDYIYLKMPYSWYLIPSPMEIVFMENEKEVSIVSERDSNREIIKDGEDVKLQFRQEFDKLPNSVNRVMLRFVNNDLSFSAYYRIPKDKPDDPVDKSLKLLRKQELTLEKLVVGDMESTL